LAGAAAPSAGASAPSAPGKAAVSFFFGE